jgi:TonB-linked SusC/RagA family outer membrane protein
MKKTLHYFLWVLLFIGTQAYSQNRTITGTVTGKDDGLPIPGVSVVIKGTNRGTQTNNAGKFSVSVPAGASLTFTFVGYQGLSLPAKENMNVALLSDQKSLNEVVVVGYGTLQRKNVTGAQTSLKGNAFVDQPIASLDQALAGKATGVQVTQSSGILGSAPRIRIRGTSSISNGSDPLYVVDGVPIVNGNNSSYASYNPLGDINPNDVASVEVLKDGAATAIYGSRASGGVILITTKKGTVGKPKMAYDAWFATAQPSKRFDLLNADQFITIANEKLFNAATQANQTSGAYKQAFAGKDANGNPINTNWQDLVFNNSAFQQNHSFSVSGANEQTNYYFSLGYANLDGIIKPNSQKKYQFRGKVEQKAFNNHLTVGINNGVSYTYNYGLNSGTNSLSGNVGNAIRAFPNVGAFNNDGTYNLSADNARLGKGSNTKEIDDNYTNIKYVIDHNIFRNQNLALNGDAFANIKIIEGLNAKTQIGINGTFGEDYQYLDPLHGDGGGATKGSETQQYLPYFRYNWINTLSYDKAIGDHNISAVAGLEYQHSRYRSFYASGSQISSTFFGGENIISNSLTQSTFGIGGGVAEQAYQSYFGRVNYSYKDRYLASATFRNDKISSLPAGNQNAKLPGGSIGWRISKESFFEGSKALSFISDLKLRGSYAKVGNTDIGNYPFAGTFAAAVYGVQSALLYNQVGNNSLLFETSKKLDIGLDMGFLKNRISVTADYFKDNKDNLILAAPTATSLGLPNNSINQNVGSMVNKGFELAITSLNIQSKDFSWNTDFNITFVKNKVTALSNNNSDIIGTYNVVRVGQSIGALYGYDYRGVNAANGNPLYAKANGTIIQGNIANQTYYVYDPANPTALTTQSSLSATADKKILGNGNPTYFGGLNNTFRYKDFDFSAFFTFSGGNKVMNVTRQESLLNQKFMNGGTELLDRWTTPGQITNVPKLYYGRDAFTNTTSAASSRFVEDGKFIRAQNLSLGYTLPKTLTNKLSLTRVRVYAEVQNAFVITDYKGLDPELNTSVTTNQNPGVDYNTNPRARTYLLGINVGF